MTKVTTNDDGVYVRIPACYRDLARYTAYTKDRAGEWSEEIDVDAANEQDARDIAEQAIKDDYDPRAGLTVEEIVGPRYGWYL